LASQTSVPTPRNFSSELSQFGRPRKGEGVGMRAG
jgi:hypothetical protein